MRSFPLHRLSKLTLGTVQLGMPYGFAVKTHPPNPVETMQLLDAAWNSGITCFDTAQAYGEAESVLGQWLKTFDREQPDPLIISKFPALAGDNTFSFVRDHARQSQQALGRQTIDAYLAHNAEDIFLPGVSDALQSLCDEGLIGSFGVSVYDPEILARALDIEGLSVVQLPASLLDQRFQHSGLLDRCAERGITVFARSVFLQGVLFLSPERLPDHLRPAAEPIIALQRFASEIGCPLASLALSAVLTTPGISSAVIGIADQAQLATNLEALEIRPELDAIEQAKKLCRGLPVSVIDPRQWR